MTPIAWLFVTVFAVYRLSELVAHDEITEVIRLWLGRKAASNRKVWIFFAKLARCPLCIREWISAIAAYLYGQWVVENVGVMEILVLWLAVSGSQYFLSVRSMDDN